MREPEWPSDALLLALWVGLALVFVAHVAASGWSVPRAFAICATGAC